MNKTYLEILGLSEGCTAEEIKAAYETMRAKYLEDRFKDGEEGNNAAKMLTKIETAYQELMNELNEDSAAADGGASFARVEELLKVNDIQEAQRILDAFNERNARWHYLQSVVFYRKSWINESKKQLEIAIQLEPDNDKYKESYRILNEKINAGANPNGANPNGANGQGYQNEQRGYQSPYQGQDMDDGYPQDQMGGGLCGNCMDFCCMYMCISTLCNGCMR